MVPSALIFQRRANPAAILFPTHRPRNFLIFGLYLKSAWATMNYSPLTPKNQQTAPFRKAFMTKNQRGVSGHPDGPAQPTP